MRKRPVAPIETSGRSWFRARILPLDCGELSVYRAIHEHPVPPVAVLAAAASQHVEQFGLLSFSERCEVLPHAVFQGNLALDHVSENLLELFERKALR